MLAVYSNKMHMHDPLVHTARPLKICEAGEDPGFFLGGGALVSRSTSTPINHIVFFLAENQLY